MGLESDKQGMEFAASSKPLKPSSNISDRVSKFAKVSRFRSIGVFNTSEDLDRGSSPSLDEEIGSSNEDFVFCASKVRSKPTEVENNGNVEILKLFDALLALKLAYMKLQEAHIPYDPEKIRAADEEVVSSIETLCSIKKAYKENQLKEGNTVSACSALLLAEIHVKEKAHKENQLKEGNTVSACSALLLAEIHVKEKALEKLKSRAKNKVKTVAGLRRELQELETRNNRIAEDIKERERESFKGLNHYSFENVVKAVGKAIHDFAKPLIALMKHSEWDLDKAASAIQPSVVYAKRSHKKYAFEAYVARRMFHGFSQKQPCFEENVMKLDDPIAALMEYPQSSFAEFCRDKYLLVVHRDMEVSFFGNLDHRSFVANGIHPHTPFYRAFVRMARFVWYLQGFSAFIEPRAEIFGVKEGSDFSDFYMEIPTELEEYKSLVGKRFKVEFMVTPGFKIGETLIKSQVYVSNGGFLNGTAN